MIFIMNDGLYDDGMNALLKLLTVLDERRAKINEESPKYENPMWEESDDLAGLGFVACRRYITEMIAEVNWQAEALNAEPPDALALGPRCATDTVARLIDTAANAWKHEVEWKHVLDTGEPDERGMTPVKLRTAPESRQQRATFRRLTASLKDGALDYKFVNTLHLIAPDLRFSTVADRLVEWRDAVLAAPKGAPRKGVSDPQARLAANLAEWERLREELPKLREQQDEVQVEIDHAVVTHDFDELVKLMRNAKAATRVVRGHVGRMNKLVSESFKLKA